MSTSERANLERSLAAALAERDVMREELREARREVQHLRGRLYEATKRIHVLEERQGPLAGLEDQFGRMTATRRPGDGATWLFESASGDGTSLHRSQDDILGKLPRKTADMPATPEKKPSGRGIVPPRPAPGGEIQPFRAVLAPDYNRSDPFRAFAHKDASAGAPAPVPAQSSSSAHQQARQMQLVHEMSLLERLEQTGPRQGAPSASRVPSTPSAQHRQGQRMAAPSQPPPPPLSQQVPQPQRRLLCDAGSRLSSLSSLSSSLSSSLPPPSPASIPAASRDLPLAGGPQGCAAEYRPGVLADNAVDKERAEEMFQFFNQVTDWVRRYCSAPDLKLVGDMERLFPRLWNYTCSATYPSNPANAASHARYMLANNEFCGYFISRLLIQYVVQKMWSAEAWEGLDAGLSKVLVHVKHRLDPKYSHDVALLPHDRQALVEKRSRAIYEFMRQPSWSRIRSQRTNIALMRFKDIVGPLMSSSDLDRKAAVHELAAISESALRLSGHLNTSRLSFQFIFNECGIKFSDQSHLPLNTKLSPRELQARHWRLMCVVTPGITYRSDVGTNVNPRLLAKANVLLMQ